MAGMSHEAGKPTAPTSMPAMDRNAMDHGSTPSMFHSGTSQPPGTGAQVAHADLVQGFGMVNTVDPSGRKINLSHYAIAAIGRPAMTMAFAVAPPVDLRQIKVGTNVSFMMERGGDGIYVIQSIMPAGGSH